MRSNQLTFMLVGLLFLTTLATAGLIYTFNTSLHKLQEVQIKAANTTKLREVLQLLANETIAYGKTNPAIEPLLKSFTNRPPAAAAAPAAK